MHGMYYATFVIATALLRSTVAVDECKGCAHLDEHNFDKVIGKFKAAVVKFDVSYPFGDKHNAFVKLSEELVTNRDILLAQVGIKDYGEKDNEELGKRYGIKQREDLPVVMLFVEGKRDPVFYDESGDWTVDGMRNFVRSRSGVYVGLPGCVEMYDRIASGFLGAADKARVVADTEKLLEDEAEEDKSAAETYVKYMRKIIEHGVDFVQQETARLGKILKEGKINDKKKGQLSHRVNILLSFTSAAKDEL